MVVVGAAGVFRIGINKVKKMVEGDGGGGGGGGSLDGLGR